MEYKCRTCLGCNRLLMEDFKGTYRCDNYVKGIVEENMEEEENG